VQAFPGSGISSINSKFRLSEEWCLMKKLVAALSVALALGIAGAAFAADPTLSGGATSSAGVITLVSNTDDGSATNDTSSATFALPATTTFAQLTMLSAEFNTTDDGCAAGSPRITIHLATGKNVFVYLGVAGNVNSCALNSWLTTGNLIGNNDVGRYDTSQIQAGTQVTTYSEALARINLLPSAEQVVSSVSFDVDAGYAFADKEQTVQLRKFTVNSISFPTVGPPHGNKSNPAKLCKAQRDSNPAAFKELFGKNTNKANAFGKCVSKMARARERALPANVQKHIVVPSSEVGHHGNMVSS
jgi:hypothetical protein